MKIPSTVAVPAGLFQKVYVDTMFMLKVNGFCYIIHVHCSLGLYPEWRKLQRETAETIGDFFFKEIICRWGMIDKKGMDNGLPYVEAVAYIARKYYIRHIRI